MFKVRVPRRAVLVVAAFTLSLVLAVPAFAQTSTPAPVIDQTAPELLNSGLGLIAAAGFGAVIVVGAVLWVFGLLIRRMKAGTR